MSIPMSKELLNYPYNSNDLIDESLQDLISIFRSISKFGSNESHLLIMDKDIAPHINFLTNNSFSKFSNTCNISRVIWYNEFRIFSDLELVNTTNNPQSFVFLLSLTSNENILKLKNFATFIKTKLLSALKSSKIHLIVTHPLLKESINLLLSNLGITGELSSINFWQTSMPLPLNSNVLTLNLPNSSICELFLNNSIQPLELLAKALLKLIISSNYKLRITNTYIQGDDSIKLWNCYKRLFDVHLQNLDDSERKILDDIDETLFLDQHSFYNNSVDFICLDRGVDLVSSLLSQLTYVGLCDDLIGINLDSIEFEKLWNENNTEDNLLKFKLGDPNDDIYPLIKDLNFSMVGAILNKKAKLLQGEYDRRKNLKDIDEMKQFVNQLNSLKESQLWVQKHTNLAEVILNKVNSNSIGIDNKFKTFLPEIQTPSYNYFGEFIELQQDILSDQLDNKQNCSSILELMYKYEPKVNDILKLLIITSIVKKGIRESEYNLLKKEILNMYGTSKVMIILLRLRKLKLFYPRQQTSFLSSQIDSNLSNANFNPISNTNPQLINNFQGLTSSLNLMPICGPSGQLPKDADFGLPGYVPVMTRLVESIYDRSFLDPKVSKMPTQSDRAIKFGWNNLDLSYIDGPIKQEFLVPDKKKNMFTSMIPPKLSELRSNRRDSIIICIIGGITMSEISTIRYVLNKNDYTKHKKLIFLTTSIVKSDDIIESLI